MDPSDTALYHVLLILMGTSFLVSILSIQTTKLPCPAGFFCPDKVKNHYFGRPNMLPT